MRKEIRHLQVAFVDGCFFDCKLQIIHFPVDQQTPQTNDNPFQNQQHATDSQTLLLENKLEKEKRRK